MVLMKNGILFIKIGIVLTLSPGRVQKARNLTRTMPGSRSGRNGRPMNSDDDSPSWAFMLKRARRIAPAITKKSAMATPGLCIVYRSIWYIIIAGATRRDKVGHGVKLDPKTACRPGPAGHSSVKNIKTYGYHYSPGRRREHIVN